MIGCRFNPRTRGILLVEMIIYVAIVFASIGVLGGATAMLSYHLQQTAEFERREEKRKNIRELMREDVRSTTRLQWFNASDAALGITSSRCLRLLQPGGRIIEYTVERQSREIYVPTPRPVQKNGPSTPRIKLQPEQSQVRTIVSPPRLVRRVGDAKMLKPTHEFEYCDIVSVERTNPESPKSIDWKLTELQQSEVFDPSVHKGFLLISLELSSPPSSLSRAPDKFKVAGTPRIDATTSPTSGEVRK